MNIDEIKRQLSRLETYKESALYHLNGEDFAYFRPSDVAGLVAEVESLTADLATAREEARSAEARGNRNGEQNFICYLIDNCERDYITEEYLQRTYADYLKTEYAESAKLPQPSAPILCTFPSCDTARALDVAQRAGMMRAIEEIEKVREMIEDNSPASKSSDIALALAQDIIRAEAQALKGEENAVAPS